LTPSAGCRRASATGRLGPASLGGAVAILLVVAACLGGGTPDADAGATDQPGDPSAPTMTGGGLRYIALGDSYTIGTSVGLSERWPDQLVAALGPEPPTLELMANVGVNGYTSRDVLDLELPQLDALRPEFVTLLIGVNDVVQGVPQESFNRNVNLVLDDLVERVGAERIVVVTIPDYTVTPAGGDFGDPVQQAAAIRAFNEILTRLATGRDIVVVDIHDLSLRAATDRSLVARDGLHPSGAQYALWVERIRPAVETLLGR
jgi:acyl-CoA thioesterase-1